MANFSVCVGRRLENPRGKLNSSIQWNWWDYSACKHAGNAREGGLPSLPSQVWTAQPPHSSGSGALSMRWDHWHSKRTFAEGAQDKYLRQSFPLFQVSPGRCQNDDYDHFITGKVEARCSYDMRGHASNEWLAEGCSLIFLTSVELNSTPKIKTS